MSMPSLTYAEQRLSLSARAAAYLELTKPRIGVLVLVTVAVSAFVGSWTTPSPWLLINTLIGTALVAASASALNQFLERRTDAMMDRTRDRPLPAGRLTVAEVLTFGSVTIIAGVAVLAATVNLVTALLGLLTWVLYVLFYTPLKSRTPFNTVVGAVAGALPVLMGWAAVDGSFAPSAGGLKVATLFVIVYLWQFPHFMAIAWIYRRQYGQAGLKMLTVVDPTGQRAGVQAVASAMALIPISLLPLLYRMGTLYTVGALILGALYVFYSIQFLFKRDDPAARKLLHTSLIYLPMLMALFVLSPYLR